MHSVLVTRCLSVPLLLIVHVAFDKQLHSLREAIQQATSLKKSLDEAVSLTVWDSLKQLEPLVEKYKACPFLLPEGEDMLSRYNQAFQLFQRAAVLSKKGARPLTMTEVRELITSANSLPVKVKTLQCLESRLAAAKEWLKSAEGCFLKKLSKQSLLEVSIYVTWFVFCRNSCSMCCYLLSVRSPGLQ